MKISILLTFILLFLTGCSNDSVYTKWEDIKLIKHHTSGVSTEDGIFLIQLRRNMNTRKAYFKRVYICRYTDKLTEKDFKEKGIWND